MPESAFFRSSTFIAGWNSTLARLHVAAIQETFASLRYHLTKAELAVDGRQIAGVLAVAESAALLLVIRPCVPVLSRNGNEFKSFSPLAEELGSALPVTTVRPRW